MDKKQTTSELIAEMKKYRAENLPVQLLQGMLIGSDWFDDFESVYLPKNKAKELIAKGHACAEDEKTIMPEWFWLITESESKETKKVVMYQEMIIHDHYYGIGDTVVMDAQRAKYLIDEGFVTELKVKATPPKEIENATLDTKGTEKAVIKKKVRRKSASDTNNSTSKSSSIGSKLKKSFTN